MTTGRSRSPLLVRLMAAACILLACAGKVAQATILVNGSKDRIHIELQDARLSDVLSHLSELYGFSFRTLVPLDHVVSGNWHGSLRSVVDRLLHGKNYVARHVDGELAIIVYGASGSVAGSNPARPISPPAQKVSAHGQTSKAPSRMIPNPDGVTNYGYTHQQP